MEEGSNNSLIDSGENEVEISKKPKFTLKNLFFNVLGFICFGLGTVGIILPILPTVPFYLATTFFFAKGSKRFNDWFVGTKLYKKHLDDFVKNRCMPMEKIILLLSGVSAMLFVSMVIIDKLAMYIVFSVLIALKCSYFLFRVKFTNIFEAKMTSRIVALIFAALMITAMCLLQNIVLYIAFSFFILLYLIYFIFSKFPQSSAVAQGESI